MTVRFILLMLLCLPGLSWSADAGQLQKSDLPIELQADELSYDREQDLYRASGDVLLIQGDLEVRGSSLQWNQGTGELEAEGNVLLSSPDERLSGDRVYYNLQKGTGVIENGHFFLSGQNLHVYGEKIERRGELDYRIYEGTFTTCDGDVPSWKFGASQVDVTLGGYARARNTVFYLNNIPSLYFPYMIYPAKTERESGLLIPGVGYSEKRGFQYSAAYYQVLGRNQDATLYLDYLSEMGIGKGLEYRYIFAGGNAGEARVYHINVDQVDGETVDDERYALQWRHDGILPGGVRLVADTEYVNDDEYFNDFGGIAGEYNKDKVQSSLFLVKHWGRYSLTGLFKYTKDLETEDDTTLQLLPRVTFDTTRQRLADSIFYYRLTSEYSHFWREEGLRGERLMLRPLLAAHIPLGGVVDLAPEIAWRERYYWGLSDDSPSDNDGSVEFSTTLSTLRLEKRYIAGQGSWSHSIRPELTYSYVPEYDQSDLPDFDDFDRIKEENHIEYALVQRLTGRVANTEKGTAIRDLAYLRLALVHDLRSEASQERFRTLRTELSLTPVSWGSLATDSSFDTDTGEWTKVSFDARVRDAQENSLQALYRYDREEQIDYGGLDLGLAIFKPVYLYYQQRYEFEDDTELEQRIAAEYRHQCWSVRLTFRDREDDRAVMLSFSMSGIGSVGDSGTSGGF